MWSRSSLFSYPELELTISVPAFAHLRRTYLQPPPHVLATVPARTCVRPCTYQRPSLQVLASADSDVYCREKAPSSGTPFPGNFHRAHVSPLCRTYEKQEVSTCDKCLPPVLFSFNRDIRLPIRVRLHPEQQHWHSSSCLPGTWPCP